MAPLPQKLAALHAAIVFAFASSYSSTMVPSVMGFSTTTSTSGGRASSLRMADVAVADAVEVGVFNPENIR